MQIQVPATKVDVLAEADVVVCGGGCAGVTAAVAAARHGASVVLLERWPSVGGMATNALVNGWHRSDREKVVILGLVEESAQRAEKEGWIAKDPQYPKAHETHWFAPEGMRIVWQRMLDEAGVRVLCYTAAGDPVLEDGRLRAVLVDTKRGRRAIAGRIFVDATGDGDVAAKAGVPFGYGREADGLVQGMTLIFQLKGIDPAQAAQRQAVAAGVLEQMRRLRDTGLFPPFNEGNFGGYYVNWADNETLWNMLPVAGNPLDEEELSRLTALSRERLVAYLQEVGFEGAMAGDIAGFSIRQAGWFVVWLALALSLLTLLLSGCFSGRRARVGAILIGLLLVVDLGRANAPWVITWNWVQKYGTNPVIDFLREKPYEHRAAVLPFHPPGQLGLLNQLYDVEWKQQLFQYYNIQSLDIVMMPRAPVDYEAFEKALFFNGTSNTLHHLTRRWQLTNTRYLLGAAGFLETLNREIDPLQHRFRFAVRFDIVPKPGILNPTGLEELSAAIKPDGQYAVFDFTGALPRAKLYANWTVSTNDQATLTNLASADFDPERTVLVADQSVPNPRPRPSEATAGQASTNSVEFTSYAPKRIVLQAKADAPSVLLLNDKFHPDWKVLVDGKPELLLRCNYVMRGVYLPAGAHAVEFRFEPPVNTLYVSLAAVAIGLALCGLLVLRPPNQRLADAQT